jgi:hypothetical protein
LSATAQCGQRDVSGSWKILLGKFKREIALDLKQSGNEISGTASRNSGIDLRFEDITVKGTVNGDKVSLIIDNRNSSRVNGVSLLEGFEGVFGPDGTITGEASVFILPGTVEVPWTSDRPMRCLHKTVGRLGVKHSNADSQGAPFIVASPNNITLPFGQTVGVATLTWDGGKDHPYAEVWVKVDGQDETKVLEKGQGTLPISIAAGRTYVYILTDAGTTLATVTVQFLR